VIPLLESAVLPSTSAIYVNWPNNPTGLIPNRDIVSRIVDFAVKHDLWILSDEVYEKILFDSKPVNLFSFPEARKRTIRVFSFSKAFGMAGNRVGYLVSDPEVTALINRLTTYLIYSVNTGGQWAAWEALRSNIKWSQQAANKYLEVAQSVAERLNIPVPQGGTFFFMNVAHHLDDGGIMSLLNSCVDEGLLLAPGAAFGPDYQKHIRLCFTSVPPEQTLSGVEILARKLGL
jgi:N-succinyldiaminopimelate aminotransferase